jgi:assimilatory nitrate reductase catalytic subunit
VFPTADGKARFFDTPFVPLAEPRDVRYPFSLTTGRLRDQWHGMSRTGTLGRLFGHVPEPVIELHRQDMARLQLQEGDLAHITSRRGSLVLPVAASDAVAPAQAFIAMHWGEEFVSGRSSKGALLAGVNALTTPAFCPRSKQPELKHCAIKVLKAELPWRLLGMAWLPADSAHAVQRRLRELMGRFAFATCVPFGHERSGVLFRAAAYEAPPGDCIDEIEALLGLHGSGSDKPLRYEDRRRGQRRTMRLRSQGADSRLEAFVLAGDISAESWIRTLLQDQLPAQSYGRLLLLPGSKAPVALASRGRQVCACFNVSEPQIRETLAGCRGGDDQRLAELQQALKCGTNCGSCLPELKRMVRSTALAA